MPFDKDDTLRQAGYSDGDFVPVAWLGNGKFSATTTNQTYAANGTAAHVQDNILWNDWFGTGTTIQASLATRISQFNGTTVDIRLQDKLKSDTIIEKTGISGSNNERFQIGPSTHSPSDRTAFAQLAIEFRSGDGSSVTINDPTIAVGVKL